jgi:Tol biopolymer transport system component
VQFSVVPQATIAAFDVQRSEVVTIELDGSQRTVRTKVFNAGIGVRPRWLPGTDKIVYSTFNNGLQELRIVDANGVSAPLFSSRPPGVTHQASPAPSRIGDWVYFIAYDDQCVVRSEYCLYRAKTDGSNPLLLGNVPGITSFMRNPSPSPEGERVAFHTFENGEPVVRIVDAAPRRLQSVVIPGFAPEWSPIADQLAFFSATGDSLVLSSTNGSSVRALARAQRGGHFSWSPDGEWIVLGGGGIVELVQVQTGKALQLSYLQGLADPSWR